MIGQGKPWGSFEPSPFRVIFKITNFYYLTFKSNQEIDATYINL